MVRRHYARPFRAICVTDEPEGIAPDIEIVRGWNDFADVPSAHGHGAVSCFRRLRAFHPDAWEELGERFVCIDLDTVIVADVTPLWDRDEDAVFWQDPLYPHQYCGSMMLLRAGSRPQVWERFDPDRSPQIARSADFMGSDQGYISWMLPDMAKWTRADGVYSYRVDCKGGLPKDARIVFFHGKPKQDAPGLPAWVGEHYR
jgi:hypothetical protein